MLSGPRKKAARKRHTEAIKQSREEGCRRLPIAKASGLCLRVPTAPRRATRTLKEDSFRPDSDACDREGAVAFCLVSSSSCLQSRTPRVAGDVSAPRTLLWDVCGRIHFGRTSSIMPAGKHIRARVVAAQSSYPRATLCA